MRPRSFAAFPLLSPLLVPPRSLQESDHIKKKKESNCHHNHHSLTFILSMASLYDETNDKTYPLEPNVPFILGRGDNLNIHDPRVSRNQRKELRN
ncbi:hypothetical protein BDB00DRAFT_819067 [Zychaea mexicana]|uniref:uncharacterized protein n=1 Tax=Zychaea mexicana TaxID=64656 RepID=UPI0022FF25BA|nr:uncharacterized protein BDB00DRAFT_819067 [Zychaea mexicana]KAI9494415.1 hypothetical protein BDB00DRAFT_819067 [Zychaea mexicana]